MTGIQKIIASFISLILLATFLFALPISNLPTSEATLFDHLFTAISFVCVSGLMSVPLTETYTAFGQIIGMIFMQIGGLSLVTILGLIMMYLKQRLSLSDSILFQTAVNRSNADQFKAFMSVVFKYTFLFEAIGFIIFLGRFVPLYGWKRSSFTALFLSISAFCNAGFDNLGLVSLQPFAKDWLINLTASSLILAGGLGFSVWFDLKSNFKFFSFRHFRLFWRQLTVNTKVVLSVTLVITTIGTLFPLIIEWNNPATIGSFNPFEKIMTSYFQSISLRTAGFSTLDYTQIYSGSAMLYLIQMLIGGSPGGTAGGIKTTTILVVLLFFYHEVRDLNHVNIFNRTINPIVSPCSYIRNIVSRSFMVRCVYGFIAFSF